MEDTSWIKPQLDIAQLYMKRCNVFLYNTYGAFCLRKIAFSNSLNFQFRVVDLWRV